MMKALVTGATRAPGRVIATTLAQGGWEVHALGRDRVALEDMRSAFGIIPLAMDLTDREYMQFVATSMEPDLIVHGALRWPEQTRFLSLAEADIDMALEVNLSAMLHVTRTVLPLMIARGHGIFIMLSPNDNEAESVIERTAAGAIETFSRALADETRGTGVSVYHLFPGRPPYQHLEAKVLSLLSASGFQSHIFERQDYRHET